MPKEPLFPHVPKKRGPLYPHENRRGGEVASSSIDRDRICDFFDMQRTKVDQLIQGTEHDGHERGFAICQKPSGALRLHMAPVLEWAFPYMVPSTCPKGEEKVGDFHTHKEQKEGKHRYFSASDYSLALTENLKVQCLGYRWKGKNDYHCQKVYPELVRPGSPQAINLNAQEAVLGALTKALDIEEEVEKGERPWQDYRNALNHFEHIAQEHKVIGGKRNA